MPYISNEKDRRIEMDEIVQLMLDLNVQATGDLNYILFKFCRKMVKPSYNNYKNYIGELRQCATEIERRLLAPYEDKKIEENGDVK
jgi:hypothetical protein